MQCFECGGKLKHSVTTLHLQKGGRPIFIENVPVTLCEQCGEEYLSGPVAEKVGELLDKEWQPQVVLSVPVFNYKMAV